MFKDRELKDLR